MPDDKKAEELETEKAPEDMSLRETLEAAMAEEAEEEVEETTAEAEENAEEEEGGEAAEQEDEDSESEEEDSEDDPLEPPAHWSAEDQKSFLEQPKPAQEFLLRRHKEMEGDYTAKTQELAPLRKTVDQWQPYLTQMGATPDQAFNVLLQTEYNLRTGTPQQKKDVLLDLADSYGISLEEPEEGESYTDPEFNKALAPLQNEISALRQQTQQQQSTAAQSAEAEVIRQVAAFKEAKDEKGNLLHPYFSEVEEKMTTLAQAETAANRVPDLADIYDQATWSVPAVREKILLAQQTAAKKAQDLKRKERAQKAAQASASVTGTGGGITEQPKSLREELEAAWKAAS